MPEAWERLLLRLAPVSIAAGLVHALVTPAHFEEWWGYGLFFLLATFAQVIYGAVPLFARVLEEAPLASQWSAAKLRAYCWAGIVGNVLVVALYVVTRTVGIPLLGPGAGVVEEVRALDVVSKLLELLLVVGLVLVLRAQKGRSTVPARSAA